MESAFYLQKLRSCKMTSLTLGSLFDGSGGFPLAAKLVGIKPIWASEIEPFAIRVTTKRLPEVQHLGDITQLNGADIAPVDIISFGSPCQDLSIAGGRQGLQGRQSNLFYEAIRIIKEMRVATNDTKPRYILWENVCGAFSSNKGADFQSVLDAVIQVKGSYPTVPMPENGKWPYSDYLMGDGWSIAYRVLDAQYFGVPQRRRRVFLVADFDGERARDILFESASLSRNFKTSKAKGQGNPRGLETSTGETICLNDQGGQRMDIYKEKSGTLKASGGSPPYVFENHSQDSRYRGPLNQVPTLSRKLGTGGNNQPFVVYDVRQTSENTRNARHNIYPCDVSRTIDTSGNHPAQNQGGLAIVEEIFSLSKNSHFTRARQGITDPLVACDYKDPPVVNQPQVRRLTPQECGRLQGFSDGWCDDLEEINPSPEELNFWQQVFETDKRVRGLKRSKTEKQIRKWLAKPHTDSVEYKLWGNGVALPCVIFILQGIVENT